MSARPRPASWVPTTTSTTRAGSRRASPLFSIRLLCAPLTPLTHFLHICICLWTSAFCCHRCHAPDTWHGHRHGRQMGRVGGRVASAQVQRDEHPAPEGPPVPVPGRSGRARQLQQGQGTRDQGGRGRGRQGGRSGRSEGRRTGDEEGQGRGESSQVASPGLRFSHSVSTWRRRTGSGDGVKM